MKNLALGMLLCFGLVAGAHAQTTAAKIPAFDATFNKTNVITEIQLPDSLGGAGNYEEELVEAYARSRLVYTGEQGTNPFRPAFVWFEFRDIRTGRLVKIYLRDRFTLRFSNGSSLEVEFLGPFAPSGLFFQVVHGSEQRTPRIGDNRSGEHGGHERGRESHYVYIGGGIFDGIRYGTGNGGSCADGNIAACTARPRG